MRDSEQVFGVHGSARRHRRSRWAGTLEVKRVGVEAGRRAVIREQAKTDSSARKLKIPPELVALLRAQLARVLDQR